MDYLTLFARKKKIIGIITATFVLLALLLSLVHPLEYSATNRLLVIQPTHINLDAYSATKSVERIGEKLSEVIYTTSFYDKVMNSGAEIDRSYFKQKERKKRTQWEKMVDTQVLRGSGMMKITVYHTKKAQAGIILEAISDVLHTSGWEYVGSMSVQINEVDSPLVSTWPVRPNFILNAFVGLLLGLIVSVLYVLLAAKQFMVSELVTRAARAIRAVDGTMRPATMKKADNKREHADDSLPSDIERLIEEAAGREYVPGAAPVGVGEDREVGNATYEPGRVRAHAIDLDRF